MRKSLVRILFAIFTTALSTNAATVAYWRFETGPAGANVLHPGADGAFNGTITDVFGNGNNLSAWTQGGYAGFAYRTDAPFGFIPQNGETNLGHAIVTCAISYRAPPANLRPPEQ